MSRSNSSPLLRLQSAEPAPSPTDDASKTSLHGGLMRGPRLLAPSARAALVAAAALLLAALACTWGAGGGGGGAPRYGPAAPTRLGRAAYGPGGRQELRRAPDSPMCRLDYSVKTWDGRLVPVCDVSKCAGRENVTALGRPAAFERRWSAEAEENFMVAFRAKKIGGWLHAPQIKFVEAMTRKQHELGVYGAVGEIGVHHGKFLMVLAGHALKAEPVVAVDLFEAGQEANVDKSGDGSKKKFVKNLERFGFNPDDIVIRSGNSHNLTARDFLEWGVPAFRMFSVDGGHSLETTLNDLMIASCMVMDGGIVIVDDFPMSTWMGVGEALAHFTHAQARLVPFLSGWNKLWLATASHVDEYRKLAWSMPEVFACGEFHGSKVAMGGSVTCYTGPSKV